MNTIFPSSADRNGALRWLMLAGAAFLVWKLWRGVRALFWTAFGLGWVLFWTQGWRVFG